MIYSQNFLNCKKVGEEEKFSSDFVVTKFVMGNDEIYGKS